MGILEIRHYGSQAPIYIKPVLYKQRWHTNLIECKLTDCSCIQQEIFHLLQGDDHQYLNVDPFHR